VAPPIKGAGLTAMALKPEPMVSEIRPGLKSERPKVGTLVDSSPALSNNFPRRRLSAVGRGKAPPHYWRGERTAKRRRYAAGAGKARPPWDAQ